MTGHHHSRARSHRAEILVAVTTVAATAPTTSTINFPLGDIRANNTVSALTGSGRLRAIYVALAGARTHLIVDLAGYYR